MKIFIIVIAVAIFMVLICLFCDDAKDAYKYKIVHYKNGFDEDVWLVKYKNFIFWKTLLEGLDEKIFYSYEDAKEKIESLRRYKQNKQLRRVKDE